MTSDAEGNTSSQPLIEQIGIPLAAIDAPPAQKIDMPWVVVAGSVRLVELPGTPRTVWFEPDGAKAVQFN